jgi:hypothetical protein
VTKNTNQVSAQDSQNGTCSDHINSSGLCHTNLKDLDKNNGVNQNIIESEPSAKTIDHISNGQSIDQEYTLLPEKQPNFRSPFPDDNKKGIEQLDGDAGIGIDDAEIVIPDLIYRMYGDTWGCRNLVW